MNTEQKETIAVGGEKALSISASNSIELSIELLLMQLVERNIKIAVKDGTLHLNAPAGTLNNALKAQLIEHKPALVKKLSAVEKPAIDMDWPRLVADGEQRYHAFPLSDVQHAYWLGRSKGIEFGNVATHYYYELDCEDIHWPRLNAALNTLIKRHDMMRGIVDENGQQKILAHVPAYKIAVQDLSQATAAKQQAQMLALRNTMSVQLHATDQWPLYDIRGIQLSETKTRLYFSWDFLNLDAWSLYAICREWATLYQNPEASLPPLAISYRDYIVAERGLHNSPLYQRDREYWWQRLDSIPEAPQLPVKADIDPNHRHQFTRRSFRLDQKAWQQLKTQGAKIGLTPSNILLTAYAEVLARWSQQAHFTLNLTFFNRLPLHEDVYNIVGDFTS